MFNSYLDGNLLADIKQEVEHELKDELGELRPEEAALLALLHRRIGKELKKPEVKESRRKAKEAA